MGRAAFIGLYGGGFLVGLSGLQASAGNLAASIGMVFVVAVVSMLWFSPVKKVLQTRARRRHFLKEKRRALLVSGEEPSGDWDFVDADDRG